MKRTIMKYSIMFSLLLLTSCDISNEEIEQKAQSYTKSEHGISVKLDRIEIPSQGKDFLGPDTRIAYVQQVDEPYLQFQIYFDGRTSPKVENDNYKIKKGANDLRERFNTYYEEKRNNTILTFDRMQTGDIIFGKDEEKKISKKHPKHYVTAVFRSNTVLDVNNSAHMETLAELARSIQEFNKTIEDSKSSVDDITIQLPNANKDVLLHIAVDYIVTAEDAKKTLEKKVDYMKALQSAWE
ncbi:hypothetical protein [Bacillus wiedmannii]|uniref:Lipoprotein n=1 Tax=Bacillus wiedmannii TaxID=1890302 RepID=A0ABD6TH56_9BACI|nr:hypothetical protein [Bacillus wiedmannii]PEA75306.1 hypothetical protein CON92_25575 [Bacillus wiedmannii]PEG07788.1 hypothetical protein CON96_23705 [Bacillus wiedmannii]PEJ48673.1 hypothetical protein CN676_21355 [Bacillus wiedmannii]PEL43368.1 hypothetical protein CN607_05495 [Bacillus wiedmannii]PEN44110.1 hypothetical protein CN630_23310 [Bacillus wiedmannii]